MLGDHDFAPMKPKEIDLKASVIEKPDDLPTSVDWVVAGAVSPVKNQGSCGSCWSFSATGTLESELAVKSGTKVILSE